LKQNLWFNVRKPACCVKQTPDGIPVEQQQRMTSQSLDRYDAVFAEFEGQGTHGQCVDRRQYATFESGISTSIQSDAYMNLTALDHGCLLRTKGFSELKLHIGKALSILG
jgi:hypothetical protein